MGAGLAIIGVSLLLMARIDVDSGWTILLPGFVLGGIGIGLTNPALASTAVGVVPPERSGMASGTNSTFRQVGIATGIAGLGALFQSRISSKLTTPDGTAPGHDLVAAVASGAFPTAIAPEARIAFVDSLGSILTIAAIVASPGPRSSSSSCAGHRPTTVARRQRLASSRRNLGARPDRSGELLADDLADGGAVGLAGDARHHVGHHATDVAQRRRADLGDDVVDDLVELVLGERLRHELLEHLELEVLLVGLLLAAGGLERLERLDALLPLALQDLQLLVLGERALQLLLGRAQAREDQRRARRDGRPRARGAPA